MCIDIIRELAIKNKYTEWYLNICRSAQKRATSRKSAKKLLHYVEAHHILPKSFKLGGEKDIENIAYLSVREHFICHLLLTKMFTGRHWYLMNYAMTCFGRKSKTRFLTSRQYLLAVSFYKNKFDVNRCLAISQSRKLTEKITCEHCGSAFDPGNYTQYHGDNCRLNPDIDMKIIKDRSKKCKDSTLKAINNGNHKHRSPISYGKLICPHCNFEGNNLPSMKRYHFERCNKNPQSVWYNKKRPQTMRKISCIYCKTETDSGNFAKLHGDKCKTKLTCDQVSSEHLPLT